MTVKEHFPHSRATAHLLALLGPHHFFSSSFFYFPSSLALACFTLFSSEAQPFSPPSTPPGIEQLRLMTFIDRLMFCAFEIVFAPAVAAGAAAVSAASAIAAFGFHFLQCVAGVRSRRMVAEHNASRPSTNALTTYLDTSGRSPHAVESNL